MLDLGDLKGKCALITGANSGVGLEAARALAGAGARVVLACRSAERMAAAANSIRADHPQAKIVETLLDLNDFDAVRGYAVEGTIDFLLLNAGLAPTTFRRSAQGLDQTMHVNVYAQWLLCGRLLPQLAADARIVVVSSVMHRAAPYVDLPAARGERRPANGASSYAMSKLANLQMCHELNRRLRDAGRAQLALPCHPGYAATAIFRELKDVGGVAAYAHWATVKLFAQSPAQGALPLLMACVDEEASPDRYYVPGGTLAFELWGAPKRTGYKSAAAQDSALAAKLWAECEALTDFKYTF